MMPFLFGRAERPLYGVYHAAAAAGRVARGVVFLNPFGQEAIRANRPYRVLAEELARRRWHVLRFDYSATGDSAGDDGEARVAQWLDDVGAAIEELRAMAALEAVHLLGMRLGATLAARVAAARRDVKGVVLWDPLLSGRAFIEEILPAWRPDHAGLVAGEAHGFVVATELANDIAGLTLDASALRGLDGVLLVATGLTREQRELARALEGGPGFACKEVSGPLPWAKANDYGAGPLPVDAMKSIAEWRGM